VNERIYIRLSAMIVMYDSGCRICCS